MYNVIGRARPYLPGALAVALVAQMLFTIGGSLVPGPSDVYGAPLPVGESGGLNFDIMGGFGSFFFPFWILNVLVTAALLLVGAIVLHGRLIPGVVAASVAVVAAYVTTLALPGSEARSNQLVIWFWMLFVVMCVWAIMRFIPPQIEVRRPPI